MTLNEITKPGVHFITEPIKLPSGTRICGTDSRIVGGVRIAVTRVLSDGVCECDLEKQGITLNGFVSRGVYRDKHPSHSELFINSRPANISRYPKKGEYLKITGVGEEARDERWNKSCGKLEGGFFYEDERPKAWAESKNIWTHGYWAWDWAPSRECVDVFDKERGFIKNLPPYGNNQYTVGRRFYFFNIREEVTEPGDYFLDLDENKLYFKPFEDTDINTAELILSAADMPAFEIDGAEDILIDGITVEGFRGDGIHISNSKNIVIRNCTLRNIGNHGMMINNSKHVYVRGCHIHHMGDSGIKINCGDRMTLERGDCAVEDCHIHDISCWDHCYEPPVLLQGVGLGVTRCVIHDCPHSAIVYQGNDMSITDNELYRCVTDTADAGVIYSGRNYTFRGNEICRNFIHHITTGGGAGGTMAIYNDDCLSGTRMDGNVFFNVQRAVFMGGGMDFEVNGNVFINCKPCIGLDGRGQYDTPVWRKMVCGDMKDKFYAVNAGEPPYSERYPELRAIDEKYKASSNPYFPPSMHASHNVFCSEETFRISGGIDSEGVIIEDNNIEVSFEELRAYLTPYQISVVFDGAEDYSGQ